ncbi:MAG: hypothetical protein WDA68_01855 [Phycisphaerae bacterium]
MAEIAPVLLSAIVCDRVIFDRFSGMPSLINILQTINAPKFPVRTGQVVFFCELTNGHGKTSLRVRLVDAKQDEKVVFQKDGVVEFKDVRQVLTLAIGLHGIVFEHPGEFRFQLFAAERLLGERCVMCQQIQMPPQQGLGGDEKVSF